MAESIGSAHGDRGIGGTRPLITISATYGAGGAVVGERVAHALEVPFLPHTFTSEQMEQAARSAAARDPSSAYLRHRVRGDEAVDDSAARSAIVEFESRSFLEESDAQVRALADTGGVVVGRAGPYVLRDVPGVLRVLLDGPQEARITAGAALEGVDRPTAERRQAAHDASRLTVARGHYGVDPNDLMHYTMMLDTTVLGLDTAVDLILAAARAPRSNSSS